MTDDDLVKYRELVEHRLPPHRARQPASRALAAAEVADVRELTALAVG